MRLYCKRIKKVYDPIIMEYSNLRSNKNWKGYYIGLDGMRHGVIISPQPTLEEAAKEFNEYLISRFKCFDQLQ